MKNNKIISLILAILLTLGAYGVFYFIYKKTNDNKTITKTSYEEWQKEDERREIIKSLDRSLKKIEVEKQALESHFVSSKDVVPFLNFFEKSGTLVGADTEVSSVSVAIDNSAILVDLKTNGSFEAVYKYITLIENSPYELEIVSFTLNKGNESESSSSTWNAIFKIKLLSFLQ
ncbi:MAG: hypothetical protein M3P22_01870 [bacterium]|nr:hypothetical protein [bacterium]